jgi:uncharacterized membrane protein
MIALHPAIVHFPIALLSIAAFFAALSLFVKKEFFREVAFWNLLLGVIGAIAAVLTGLIEEQNLAHNEDIHRILIKHKFTGFGILILSFALLTWIWVRKNQFGKKEYMLWVAFLLLSTGMIFYQGFLGGKMVFEQGAGVKPMEIHMEEEGGPTKTHDHSGSSRDHSNSPTGHDNAHDTSSAQKPTANKAHDHPTGGHRSVNNQDSVKRKDSTVIKEKKKELKNMKY